MKKIQLIALLFFTTFSVANAIESPSNIYTWISGENWFFWWEVIDYVIEPTLVSDFSTFHNLDFKKIEDWELPVNVLMKHSSWRFSAKIKKWTEVLNKKWEIIIWKILSPKILFHREMPKINWNIIALKAFEFWTKNTTFSKEIELTFSYKWISKNVNQYNLNIYYYKDWQYFLENKEFEIDEIKKEITFPISWFKQFIITNWKLSWIKRENFKKEVEEIIEEVIEIKIPFRDISGHWSKTYVEKLYKNWVLDNKKYFRPNSKIKRIELVKMVVEAFWHWRYADISNIWYSDIEKNAWYARYLSSAIRKWIIYWPNVKPEFKPWEYVNRAEAIKMILEASKLNVYKVHSDFSDISGEWFEDYVNFAWKNWIIWGYWDSKFRPSQYITRWEVAKIIIRTLKLTE